MLFTRSLLTSALLTAFLFSISLILAGCATNTVVVECDPNISVVNNEIRELKETTIGLSLEINKFSSEIRFLGDTIKNKEIINISCKNPEPNIMPISKPPLIRSSAKDISEIIRNYATCIAFAIAGFWAYLTFIRKRGKYPRAKIKHIIMHEKINDDKILLRVTVDIYNTGDTVMHLDRRLVRVQQMIPCPMVALNPVYLKEERIKEEESEIQWPLLAEIDLSGKGERCEIEPEEKEEFDFDFVIDSEIKRVLIYSYLKNRKKRSKEIGWNKTTIYDIK